VFLSSASQGLYAKTVNGLYLEGKKQYFIRKLLIHSLSTATDSHLVYNLVMCKTIATVINKQLIGEKSLPISLIYRDIREHYGRHHKSASEDLKPVELFGPPNYINVKIIYSTKT
jgi:hypothetical protein